MRVRVLKLAWPMIKLKILSYCHNRNHHHHHDHQKNLREHSRFNQALLQPLLQPPIMAVKLLN